MTEERKQKLREIFVKVPAREWWKLASTNQITRDECIFLYAQKAKLNTKKPSSKIDQEARELADRFGGVVID